MSLIYTSKAENGRKNIVRRSRLLLFLSALWNFFRLSVVLCVGIMSLGPRVANAQKAGDWHPDLDAYDMGQAQVASAAKPKRTTAALPKAKRQTIFVSTIASAQPLPHSGTALERTCGNSLDDIPDFFTPHWMPLTRLRDLASDNCRQAQHPASSRRTIEPTGGAPEDPERDRFSRDAWDRGDCTLAEEMNDSAATEEKRAAEREQDTTSRNSFPRQLITSPFAATDANPF